MLVDMWEPMRPAGMGVGVSCQDVGRRREGLANADKGQGVRAGCLS